MKREESLLKMYVKKKLMTFGKQHVSYDYIRKLFLLNLKIRVRKSDYKKNNYLFSDIF